MEQLKKTRQVAACWVLLLGVLLLSGCMEQAGGAMKSYTAEEFFSGKLLQLAQMIEHNDLNRFRAESIGVDLAAAGRRDMTLLWFAMLPPNPNFEAVRLLIELGVNPDKQTAKGIGSALSYAIKNKDLRYLTAMLDGGISPDHHEPKYKQMLQRAAGPGGSLAHVRLLVERGANIDLQDSLGRTALNKAITSNHPDVAIYLIHRGINFNTVDLNGVTPAWGVYISIKDHKPSTVRDQFEELRDLLISKGAKWPPDPPEVVREWMREQGMKVVVPYGWDR